MKSYALLLLLITSINGICQSLARPEEVTPAIERKIRQEVESATMSLRRKLTVSKENEVMIEFTLDTCRIEAYMNRYTEHDYSTAGIVAAGFRGADQYDSLLNKYYKRLLNVLEGEDKKVLVQAQRSWLAFRNAEIKLTETLGKEAYSGGGTVQRIIYSSAYLDIIRNRVVSLFEHLNRTVQP